MECAPQDEVEARAMPEAAKEHGQEEVHAGAPLALPISAERDVEVVAQPARQADVPALPKIARRVRVVRRVEVDRELQAQHPREAARHVGIAAEVEVDLEREADHGEPHIDASIPLHAIEDGVRVERDAIGNEDLLQQAAREEQHSVGHARIVDRRFGHELRQERARTDDGAGDELRKKADERGELEERARRLQIAPVDVDRVAHGLKRVEADAGGQHDFERRVKDVVPGGRVHGGDEEAVILEEREQPEVERERQQQDQLAARGALLAIEEQADAVVDRGAHHHEERVPTRGEGVKRVARGDHEDERVLSMTKEAPAHHHQGQKDEEKPEAVEGHPRAQPICSAAALSR